MILISFSADRSPKRIIAIRMTTKYSNGIGIFVKKIKSQIFLLVCILCKRFNYDLVASFSFPKICELDFFMSFSSDQDNISWFCEISSEFNSIESFWNDKEFFPL